MEIAHTLSKGNYWINKEIDINGWIANCRVQTNIIFISLNDGSSLENLQIVIDITPEERKKYSNIISDLAKGASITVKGKLIDSIGKNQDVEMKTNISNVTIIGNIDPETSVPPAEFIIGTLDFPINSNNHFHGFSVHGSPPVQTILKELKSKS